MRWSEILAEYQGYSEISILPGTPQEAKNIIIDILTEYQGLGENEIPLKDVLKRLHRQNFDIDRNMLIDMIKDESPIDRISDGVIYIKQPRPEEDFDVVSDDEEQKSKEKVEKMAKKALKKKKGE